jgi:hypothetical protein
LLPNWFDSAAKQTGSNLRQLIDYEVCKYKLSECLNGRNLWFEQAWGEWLKPHQGSFEQVLIKTLLLLHEAASLTNVGAFWCSYQQ